MKLSGNLNTETNMVKLFNGDCMQYLPDINDASINMILCDLPYGTTDCKWDNHINLNDLWKHYKRIISPTGCIALFGSEPFASLLRTSNRDMYKYDWIWIKTKASNFLNAKLQPLKITENISIFSKGKSSNGGKPLMTYYPQGLTRVDIELKNSISQGGEVNMKRGKSLNKGNSYAQTNTGYPNNILHYKSEYGLHPTQKPVSLMEYLIKTYTNEGETVLDNCMGSGTTGVACKRLNRSFIGIEKDAKYFDIATKRIQNEIEGAGGTVMAAIADKGSVGQNTNTLF
jgi:site-specific DNA-methyltransferase (adenine-specific)